MLLLGRRALDDFLARTQISHTAMASSCKHVHIIILAICILHLYIIIYNIYNIIIIYNALYNNFYLLDQSNHCI